MGVEVEDRVRLLQEILLVEVAEELHPQVHQVVPVLVERGEIRELQLLQQRSVVRELRESIPDLREVRSMGVVEVQEHQQHTYIIQVDVQYMVVQEEDKVQVQTQPQLFLVPHPVVLTGFILQVLLPIKEQMVRHQHQEEQERVESDMVVEMVEVEEGELQLQILQVEMVEMAESPVVAEVEVVVVQQQVAQVMEEQVV
jgi:hypothetical protein